VKYTEPSLQRVPQVLLRGEGVMWLGCAADCSFLSSAETKNTESGIATLHTSFGVYSKTQEQLYCQLLQSVLLVSRNKMLQVLNTRPRWPASSAEVMNEQSFISTLLQYVGKKFSAKLPGKPAEVVLIFLCLYIFRQATLTLFRSLLAAHWRLSCKIFYATLGS